MIVRGTTGAQRGTQTTPGVTPEGGADPAQQAGGGAADFSAVLSQLAAQVGGANAAETAGSTLIKVMNSAAASRQEARPSEPARSRSDRDRPDRADAPTRADRSDRKEDRKAADEGAPAQDAADPAASADGTAAVDQAAVQVQQGAAALVEAAQPQQTSRTVEAGVVADAQAEVTDTVVEAAPVETVAAVTPQAAGAGQAETQVVVATQATQTRAAQSVDANAPVQTTQGAQAQVQTAPTQAQTGADQDTTGQQQASGQPVMAETLAGAKASAKTAGVEAAAANVTDPTAGAQEEVAEGPLTTVNAAQSKGLAKAVGDDRPVSVQVQVETTATPTRQDRPVDAPSADAPKTWYELAKAAPATPPTQPASGNTADTSANGGMQAIAGLPSGVAGGAANSAATAAASAAADGVEGVKGSSGTSQTSTPTAATATSATQAGQQAAKTQAAKPVFKPQQSQEPDPVEQIKVKIVQDATKGETIKIALRPDNLGKVEVKLDIREGKVQAHVVAETSEALEMMKTDARGLEKALNDAGLRADPGSVSFSLKDNGAQQQMAQDQGQNQGRQGPGTPYDTVGQSIEDELSLTVGTIDALRSAQAMARGGVDVRI